jgi:ATP-dependent DNA helicase PIF1
MFRPTTAPALQELTVVPMLTPPPASLTSLKRSRSPEIRHDEVDEVDEEPLDTEFMRTQPAQPRPAYEHQFEDEDDSDDDAGMYTQSTNDIPHDDGEDEPVGRVDGFWPEYVEVLRASQEDEVAPSIRLSKEQRAVVFRALSGESLLISGGAGCGKSVVVKLIAKLLQHEVTAVTAMTGMAALQVSGRTIHSWSGVGLYEPTKPHSDYIKKLSKMAAKRWRECKTLIIDEVSMLDANFFECLDAVGRYARNDQRPFGGIQLVLCGDFMQLPPVSKNDQPKVDMLFRSKLYRESRFISVVVLTQLFRQRGDDGLARYLNEIRSGDISDEALEALQATANQPPAPGGEYVRLRPRRDDVKRVNDRHFAALGDLMTATYRAYDMIGEQRTTHKDDFNGVDHIVELRVGARVMLRKNISATLVNGSCGVVEKLVAMNALHDCLMADEIDLLRRLNATHCPVVRFDSHKTAQFVIPQEFSLTNAKGQKESRLQLPLVLAWAITIHKSQGMTLERVDVDLSGVFEKGQAYVALSRAKSLAGLRIVGLSPGIVKADSIAKGFYEFHIRCAEMHTPDKTVSDAAALVDDLDRALAAEAEALDIAAGGDDDEWCEDAAPR